MVHFGNIYFLSIEIDSISENMLKKQLGIVVSQLKVHPTNDNPSDVMVMSEEEIKQRSAKPHSEYSSSFTGMNNTGANLDSADTACCSGLTYRDVCCPCCGDDVKCCGLTCCSCDCCDDKSGEGYHEVKR